MKNSTHESDREKATCIINNLTFNKSIKKSHPFFNKKKKQEPDINLHAEEMFQMAQLTMEEFERLKGQKEKDFRKVLHKQRTMKLSPDKIKQQENFEQKETDKVDNTVMSKIQEQLQKYKLRKQFAEFSTPKRKDEIMPMFIDQTFT